MKPQISRYIPKNALPIEEAGLGVVYVYPFGSRDGKAVYGAIAYAGNANKSAFHYTFKTDAQLDAQIQRFFDSLRRHKELVEQRRVESNTGHAFIVGDIVTNSWGYDQTNVDWYRVTRTTKNFVWLRPISSVTLAGEGFAPMAGLSTPAIDTSSDDPSKWGFAELDKPETKHKAQGDYCSMRHGCGSKWDGRAKYESWYH